MTQRHAGPVCVRTRMWAGLSLLDGGYISRGDP